MSIQLLFILACVFGAAAYILGRIEENNFYKRKEKILEDIKNYKDNSYNKLYKERTLDGWKSEYIHNEREKELVRKYNTHKDSKYLDIHNRYPALHMIFVWGAWISFVMFVGKLFSPFF